MKILATTRLLPVLFFDSPLVGQIHPKFLVLVLIALLSVLNPNAASADNPVIWVDLENAREGIQSTLGVPQELDSVTINGSVILIGNAEDVVSSNLTKILLLSPPGSNIQIDIPLSATYDGELSSGLFPPNTVWTSDYLSYINTVPGSKSLGEDLQITLFNFTLHIVGLDTWVTNEPVGLEFQESILEPSLGIRINGTNYSFGAGAVNGG